MYRNNKGNFKKIEFNEVYKRAVNGGNFGVFEWSINKNEMFISEKIKELTGYKFEYVKDMMEFINVIAYEEDKILAMRDLNRHISGDLPFYQSTFRIKNQNGQIRWVRFKGKIFKDKAGRYNLFSGVMSDVTKNKMLEGCDNLTRIPNRVFIFEELNNLIKDIRINNRKGALIYIDIDNFKNLNDNFGWHFGDMILVLFSQLITTLLDKHGKLARLGGDEFIILIDEFNDIKEIEEICNRIQEYMEKPFEVMDKKVYITVSLGVTIFPDDSSNMDELLKFCSFAMYKSKNKGKNMCTFFDKQIAETYFRKILIESQLKNSINNNELDIFYQPQIDAKNNEIIGIEALLRWNNCKLGNVSPREFIPIAEDIEYIIQIGNWVLDESLKTASRWRKKGYKFNVISVNISPIQIKRIDFKDNLLNTCAKYNIPPSSLEIEITEGTLMEACKDRIEALNQLIKSGVNIAIDDFGTGYSSLNYLVTLPVNTLKIDKSFIDNIKNEKNKALIKCILNLSKSLKYKIVTEGVETKEQMDLLVDLGCNIIQGYYFSKPLPLNEIEDLLEKKSEMLKIT
ncbi:GGDEF and EAL domain-containing protein [Clostridium sp. PL3]|uniref:GGDEF and EAL domain-containing protein n=1 Tax=Clostridium thailandense TaxID=2794346 RepID=A0A949TTV8_9CLOT|nr:GGDEF and EAL domain-containing protein [Clostridium thailandense]MBV7271801.1 GGDEF and EAL domain-containing protein [Clostridium thailandense]